MGMTPKQVMEALDSAPREQIQEQEFVSVWLPLFAGLAGPAPIDRWLHVAKSPYAEVDVMAGDVKLFTVPPLLSGDNKLTSRFNEINVHHAIDEVQLHYNVHPGLGNAKMQSLLIDRVGKGTPRLTFAHRMNDIFTRYNLPLIPVQDIDRPDAPVTGSVEKPLTAPTFTSEDFEEL